MKDISTTSTNFVLCGAHLLLGFYEVRNMSIVSSLIENLTTKSPDVLEKGTYPKYLYFSNVEFIIWNLGFAKKKLIVFDHSKTDLGKENFEFSVYKLREN